MDLDPAPTVILSAPLATQTLETVSLVPLGSSSKGPPVLSARKEPFRLEEPQFAKLATQIVISATIPTESVLNALQVSSQTQLRALPALVEPFQMVS